MIKLNEQELDLLRAAKEAAEIEQVMYEQQERYEVSYAAFKTAQQNFYDKQRAWLKQAGLLPPVPEESTSAHVYDAQTSA